MKSHDRPVPGRVAIVVSIALAVWLVSAGPAAAQYGYTQGGYGGAALGAVAGSAAGSALIAAAGITNPLLSGTLLATATLGSGYLGAKLGSKAGNTADKLIDSSTMWTMVGAVSGSLMGFIFGPAGSMIGKVLGAGIGAAVGGWAGHYLSSKANQDYNPRTVGALVGGVNGALLAGPLGAAVGVPLGYIGGNLLDKYVFSKNSFGSSGEVQSAPWQQGGQGGQPLTYYYPDQSGSKWADGSGYDRQGYDRAGYDRDGYDREGYDRFGYDRFGYDRDGFNKKGYKKTGSAGSSTVTTTYDPTVYNQYWQAWNQVGGDYPILDKSHFAYYPESVQSAAYDRYTVEKGSASASVTVSTDLVALKQEYMKAIEAVQSLAKQGSSATAAYTEAMKKLAELEAQLKEKMGQEAGSK